jgi:RNA polymerase sigma-70 factor (ECF subfamily)
MDDATVDTLLARGRQGDALAMAALFERYRQRLRRMVEIRLDRRLMARVDPSDVLQEAYVEAQRKIGELQTTPLPFFLWLRMKVAHRLIDLHRFHLGAQKRSVTREVSLLHGPLPLASSASLASQLAGKLTTASNAAMRAEQRLRIQAVLNAMDEIDREVLVLRHFEDLTNAETSQVLGISQNAASNRYVRALRRLKGSLP